MRVFEKLILENEKMNKIIRNLRKTFNNQTYFCSKLNKIRTTFLMKLVLLINLMFSSVQFMCF